MEHKYPFSDADITFSDGRKMVVVSKHHASPIERWQMWKYLNEITKEADRDGVKMPLRKRLGLRLFFISTLLKPDCKACTYAIQDPA